MPAIATTLILNFIQLWNEFLFAVVLITDPDKRTLPVGIRAFMGDHFRDIGMIATGVVISVIPVIIVSRLLLRETHSRHDCRRNQMKVAMAVVTLDKLSKQYGPTGR